ncbi:MAG TPA: histidine kinase [Streptosporangiaceae bacterium]
MARRIDAIVAFLIKSEPRRPLSPWSFALDAVIAVAAAIAAVMQTISHHEGTARIAAKTHLIPVTAVIGGTRELIGYLVTSSGQILGITMGMPKPMTPQPGPSVAVLIGVVLTAAPLAVRRRYPLATVCVIFAALILCRDWAPPVTFATAVLGAYSAVVHSRFRQIALGVVLTFAIITTMTFPNTLPHFSERYTALIVVLPTIAVALGIRELRRRLGDSTARLRRAAEEQEAATRRAIEAERARIAAELHDVLTHNVSVMVVQAGAARRILATSPDEAAHALLAVESSGRTAMTELRHLLGLLCPRDEDTALRPQPGLAGVDGLVSRMRTAGLATELSITGTPRELSPGLDLAAYRVVQEGLTNVIRHAGEAVTYVRVDWGEKLEITVTDNGSGTGAGLGSGRGLIGLRERLAVYGGELNAGPLLDGGWRLRAMIPLAGAPAELIDVLA